MKKYEISADKKQKSFFIQKDDIFLDK